MRGRLAVAAALVLLVLGTGFDPWQTTWRETREGNRALEEGNAEEAVRHYTEALSRAPDDPRILFDLGNALARLGRLDEARQAWDRAASLGEGTIRRDAWYNRGLAELLGGDARAAAEAFTRALLVDPGDEEARRNLDLALRQLRREQQQRQPQGGGGRDRQEQQQDRSERGRQGSEQQQQRQQQGEQQRERQEQQRRQQQQQQGKDRRQDQQQQQQQQEENREKRQGDRAQQEQDRLRQGGQQQPRQERQAGAAAGKEGAEDREAREMAERLLRRLAEDEKDALRRALRRRVPAGKKREKDW